MRSLYCIIICVVTLNASCSEPPPSKDLIGKYSFSDTDVHDTLHINGNYTYDYKFHATGGKVFKSGGTWRYDSIAGKITFEDFVFYNNSGPELPAGYWVSTVRVNSEGEVQLMYSLENNVYYFKIE